MNEQPRHVPGAAITGVFAVAFLFLVLCMNRTINVYDEGLILFGAARVLDGAVPHRDFYANYGPAQFYVLAALYKIFGASVLVERAWDTFVRSGVVVLVFIIVDRFAPRVVAALTAIGTLVFLASLIDSYGYPVFPALAAALAGLAFLTPALGREAPSLRLIAAGGCAGVAMLFRYDVGAASFGAEIAILAFNCWSQDTDRLHSVTRTLSLFGLGFAVVVVPVATAFAVAGALPDLVFDVVVFPARFYVKTRSLPFPGLSSLLDAPSHGVIYLPLVICLAAIPTIAALAHRQRREGDTGPEATARRVLLWTLSALVVLTLVYFGKGMVRKQTNHMAMAIVTSLTLAGVLAQAAPKRGLVGFCTSVVACPAVAILLLFSIRVDIRYFIENVVLTANPAPREISAAGIPAVPGSCRVPAGLQRLACFRTDPGIMESILYVRQRTTPDDSVFIGLPRHDKIFVNDVLLYFAMDRKSATKWHHFDPGLQTSAPIQREMVAELQRARPKLVVIEPAWAASIAPEPNDSALSSGVTILDDYLKDTYEPVATFHTITVLRPRAAAPAGIGGGDAGSPPAARGS